MDAFDRLDGISAALQCFHSDYWSSQLGVFLAEGGLEWPLTMGSGQAVPGGADQHHLNRGWYQRRHLRMCQPKNINRVKNYDQDYC